MSETKHIEDFAPTDRQSIMNQLEAYWHSWEHSVEEASNYYSHDQDVNIWDGTAVEGPGWSHYGDLQEEYMKEVKTLKNNGAGEVQILQQGDLLVTVAVLRNTGEMKDGSAIDATMRETLVWTKQNGRWCIIHEHSSPMPKDG